MSDRKMGPREAQIAALREARYLRAQAASREPRTAPATKKPTKKPKKKRGK